MTAARRAALAASLAALVAPIGLAPGAAEAGGLARPNPISARSVSLGGAFVAVADDPTALHFNPAGVALLSPGFLLGAELVIAPRTYTPVDAAGTRGPEQSATPIVPLPSLGVAGRVGDRIVLAGGVWNTYGGQLHYEKTGASAIDESQEAVIEVVGGIGYRVTDHFTLGAAVRLGIGLFKVVATNKPVTSDLSGFGVGVGASLGAMWLPTPRIRVGGAWRSELAVAISGSGALDIPGLDEVDVSHTQPWPQSASLGVALAASERVTVSTQVDWTQWSRWERLDVTFPGNEAANQSFPLDWSDSYAVRLGVEWRISPRHALRAGAYFDSNAVPDRTIERQYLDADKVGGSLGFGLGVGRWRVDVAADVTAGPPRVVPDNSALVGEFRDRANIAPGDHQGSVFTFELAASRGL